MPIPETQLETWSHQGSVTQSASTYQTIKSTLEAADSPYAAHDFTVFLQGSYGNDTNIYRESDVDIVVRLNSCFYRDDSELPPEQQTSLANSIGGAPAYCWPDFHRDVLAHLTRKFGTSVDPGDKAIKVKASGNRRNADVVVAAEFRRYVMSGSTYVYYPGICFFTKAGIRIANYPKHHSENCTTKHQGTNKWFKPTVRILKNMRSKLVESGAMASGVAPSYYIEGLLYNVPAQEFGKSYVDTFVNSINWIMAQDRSKFVCANEQYYLLFEGSPVTWRAANCDTFLDAICKYWKEW